MDCLRDMWELQNVEVEMVQLRREWSRIKDLISKDNYGDHEDIQAGIEVAREQWQKIKEDFNVTVTEIEKIGRKLEQLNHQLYRPGRAEQGIDLPSAKYPAVGEAKIELG